MEFLETIINGLSIGGTYAMIALGYTMVYGIAKMLNFAHGDVIMVGGYSIYLCTLPAAYAGVERFLSDTMGMTEGSAASLSFALVFIFSILMAVIVCTVLGVTIEKLAYKPLRGASPLAVLITAIGVSYLLQSGAQMVFGSAPKMVIFDFGMLHIGSLSVQWHTIITLICSVVIMAILTMFIKYTRVGRAMVAVSEDKGAAQLMGINSNAIITLTFAIGSALAAVASMFMLMKSPSLTNTMGAMPGIKAFTAAVIGGIGSVPGAMLGGILIGFIEAIALKFAAIAPYTDAIEFLVLIVILLFRPSGILGKKRREKV